MQNTTNQPTPINKIINEQYNAMKQSLDLCKNGCKVW